MASDLDSTWPSPSGYSFSGSLDIRLEEANSADILPALEVPTSSVSYNCNIPKPPPLPNKVITRTKYVNRLSDFCSVPNETVDAWDKLFKEGLAADVYVVAEEELYIPSHSSILSILICRAMHHLCWRICCSKQESRMLRKGRDEEDWLTKENVVDVLQLARNCDAPRLSLCCVHMVVKDFKAISSTEGWKVMRRANPALEQELLESVVEADTRKEERLKKIEEKKVYLQLNGAMEALLHICRDGCRTIGPRDKVLKGSQVACGFPACKGLETLVRHFSSCKTRVPGGCVHCKRMWQLRELHSRMCDKPDACKVRLCRHFKEKMQQQSKKDEAKWKLLASKVIAVKNAVGAFSAAPRAAFL